MRERKWSIFWIVAGIFNMFFGLIMLFDYQLFYKFLGAANMAPSDPCWLNMTACVIVMFGFGYCVVGRNLHGHLDIVIIGAIGKMAVWCAFAVPHLLGSAGINNPLQMGLLTCVDLLFGFVFMYFLYDRKNLPSYQATITTH